MTDEPKWIIELYCPLCDMGMPHDAKDCVGVLEEDEDSDE